MFKGISKWDLKTSDCEVGKVGFLTFGSIACKSVLKLVLWWKKWYCF